MAIIVSESVRRKVLNPTPKAYVDQILKEAVWLINITEQDWFGLQRSYGSYSILGCKDGEEYAATEINGRIECRDHGDSFSEQTTGADAIAEDLCGQINGQILTIAGGDARVFMGVFISKTEEPSRAALADARKRLMAFYKDQVKLADQFWDDPRNHKDISNLHHRAALALKIHKPWLYESTEMTTCVGCDEPIKPGVPLCKSCDAIQPGMEARARELYPWRFAHETQAPETRKPRKPAEA